MISRPGDNLRDRQVVGFVPVELEAESTARVHREVYRPEPPQNPMLAQQR
jgi:hypothetical protein